MSSFLDNLRRRLSSMTNPLWPSKQNTSVTTSLSSQTTVSQATPENAHRVIKIETLMADEEQPVTDHMRSWFEALNLAVLKDSIDGSVGPAYQYDNYVRIIATAHRIWRAEKHHPWAKTVDPLIIYTAALAWNIGNSSVKVEEPSTEEGQLLISELTSEANREKQRDTIRGTLEAISCPPNIAAVAADLASWVLLPREFSNPRDAKAFTYYYPALKIVQDAVRLEELGVRDIAHLGATGPPVWVTDAPDGMTPFTYSLLQIHEHVLRRMKTNTGKEMAAKRLEQFDDFREEMMKQHEENKWVRG